jgi:dynein heavy chain
MGCAPAGPAGTGKTETTKDLSSALAKAIYVFNCSDQMDFRGMGGIFKGLAASGSWGCFDEFNRLLPSVLSVCTVQFKAVTDAIKQQRLRFILMDDEISLDPTCGAFITMNPGYLGRAELPEGLKALFRPITVVVPDLELICENMLMAEGFIGARILAKKFTTLYALCKDLLSKAPHYDWGLRAIKSVLVVAGKFKRAEPELPEPDLLMRALRDFNLPKIVAEDLQIFMDLLGDLFPGINPPRKRDMTFEQKCRESAESFNLYPDEEFILKVVQLSELLVVRHCVFVMGPPGAGKSSTWKTLAEANSRDGRKTTVRDLNPKVVKTDELYGVVHMQTREWIDGLMSSTMRSLGQIENTDPKWIALDGDLDANWIESMNSVMDDNKILTLASNERIPLKAHMRLIFEIRDLRFATPATVSRAGILFISDTAGYQWKAYVKSWLQQ